MKIVINTCFGGFKLAKDAVDEYLKRYVNEYGQDPVECGLLAYDIDRTDAILVSMLEENPDLNFGQHLVSSLGVVEIPDDVDWEIADYDGKEWIAERHRTWRWHSRAMFTNCITCGLL